VQENDRTGLLNGIGAPTNKSKGSVFDNKNVFIIATLAVVVLLLMVGSYKVGSDKGYDKGYSKGKSESKNIADTKDPLGLLSREENRNYWSIVGTVESVDDKSITVKNNKGKIETATFNDDLEVTQKKKDGNISKSDIKSGQQVIVTGKKTDNKPTASRVIIKE
ncbi:hypothetical protein KDA11_06850, partial [Candidatus Saccharibacteria bacterium]|nr:hypothetical protein [Candidatus Saccharibacteria bacterium]